jgi:hypothetical protein
MELKILKQLKWVDYIGISGVSLIIAMYLLLQLEKIDPTSIKFSLLNASGSLLIIFSLTYHWNVSSFFIEFFWVLISLFGLYKAIKKRSQTV